MNSRELAIYAAKFAGIDIEKAQKVITAIPMAVVSVTRRGGTVRLGSLGTFAVGRRKKFTYKNIKTGAIVTAPAKKVLKFKIARAKKDII